MNNFSSKAAAMIVALTVYLTCVIGPPAIWAIGFITGHVGFPSLRAMSLYAAAIAATGVVLSGCAEWMLGRMSRHFTGRGGKCAS